MARVPYLTAEDLDPADRELLARPIALYRALGNSPDGLRAVDFPTKWIRNRCELDPRSKELVMLAVGYLTANAYEFSHHVRLGLDAGVTEADIQDLIDAAHGRDHGLGDTERLLFTATREILGDHRITDDTWKRLEAAIGTARVVDVVVIVGFYAGVVRVLDALEVDVEDDYLQYLERFPLPDAALV